MTHRYKPLDASGICANCGYRRSGHVGKGMVCLDQGGGKDHPISQIENRKAIQTAFNRLESRVVAEIESKAVQAARRLVGRVNGRLGGKARKRALTASRRSEIARMGGLAGGSGRGKAKEGQTMPKIVPEKKSKKKLDKLT